MDRAKMAHPHVHVHVHVCYISRKSVISDSISFVVQIILKLTTYTYGQPCCSTYSLSNIIIMVIIVIMIVVIFLVSHQPGP